MTNITSIIGHFPYVGLFLMLILGGIGFPFPEDATLILCGFLISTHVVKPLPALLVTYSGLLIGDFLLYLIGKKYGRMIVTHKRFHKILSPERLSILEEKFKKKGILILLFGRHLVGLRVQIFLVSGIMKMPALKFLIGDAVSAIFTMSVMVSVGFMGGESLQVLRKDMTRIAHAGILLVIALFVIYLVRRSLKKS